MVGGKGEKDQLLVIPDGSTVTLCAATKGWYLSAQRMLLVTSKYYVNYFEKFEVEVNKNATVSFKTYHGSYLRASSAGLFRHMEGKDKKNEFKIILSPDSSIHLETYCGTYVFVSMVRVSHGNYNDPSTKFKLDIINPHQDASSVLCVSSTESYIVEGHSVKGILKKEYSDPVLKLVKATKSITLSNTETSVVVNAEASSSLAVHRAPPPQPPKSMWDEEFEESEFRERDVNETFPDLYDSTDLTKSPFPIQSYVGHICFMSAKKNGQIISASRHRDAEMFRLEPHPFLPHKFSIRTYWGTFLSVSEKGKLKQRDRRGKSEFFVLRKFAHGATLQAYNGQFVCLTKDGNYGLEPDRVVTTQFHFHGSFAPVRSNIDAKFYVDGEEYFTALYNHLKEAQECIYITGWFLSPNFYLLRPALNPEHILSTVLHDRAKKGVQVRILLWNNIESVAPNKHNEGKEFLESLHTNIKVELQPLTSLIPSSWSHHQKSVMIDYKIAFVGGLDLSLYRWDTCNHDVVEKVYRTFVGKDYYNGRFTTAVDLDVHKPAEEGGVDRTKYPRMPWHDVHMSVDGPACADVINNFVQRWNHSHLLQNKLEFKEIASGNGKGEYDCQVVRSISGSANGMHTTESSVREAYCKTIAEAESFVYIENQYFIDPAEPKFISRAIIDRVTRAIAEDKPFQVVVVLPQYPDNGDPTKSSNSLLVMYWQRETIQHIFAQIDAYAKEPVAERYISFFSLRNYGCLGNKIVTEQIYVHAKVMISDKSAVVGSANINARSLYGNRDTELSVVVKSPKFSSGLLRKLVSEHSGIQEDALPNNMLEFFQGEWRKIAENNTGVYCHLFGKSIPDGEPTSLVEYSSALQYSSVDKVHNLHTLQHGIRGHLVKYPSRFLSAELGGSLLAVKWQFMYNSWRKVSDLFN